MNRPDKKNVERYLAGTLSEAEHATVELWLDQQEESLVTTVLEEAAANVSSAPGIGQSAELDLKDQFYFTPDFRFDRYRYQGDLGSGGMGVVELAEDQSLIRSVAIKRCRARSYNEDVRSFKQRQRLFQREAEVIGGLEHPGIIPIHEIGIDASGNPAMVMKALSGQNFEQWRNTQLENDGRVDIAEGLRIIVKIADALAYAHENGIVHRDIKVDNVVIGEHGAVTVIDWGLAVKMEDDRDLNLHEFKANAS